MTFRKNNVRIVRILILECFYDFYDAAFDSMPTTTMHGLAHLAAYMMGGEI